MKTKLRKALSLIMAAIMAICLFPVPASAYVGAMTRDPGGIQAAQKDGYYYLTNDYIGFYIRPDGNLTTVPSQKTLSDVKTMGATERHIFYKMYTGEIREADYSNPVSHSGSTVTIIDAGTSNPKLKQVLTIPSFGATITIIYELVQLDAGAEERTFGGAIIERDGSDNGRTWGVLSSVTASYTMYNLVLWATQHYNFGGVGHKLTGAVRLNRRTVFDGKKLLLRVHLRRSRQDG